MSNLGSIFISYRRSDSKDFTRTLYDKLAPQFDQGMVFRDLDTIDGGLPWKGFIENKLAECRVLLAVIGPTWLEASREGKRRLDNPNDWVRREIEYAFINGIPIIPVLINGAQVPNAASLPGAWLTRLPMLQVRRLSYGSEIDQGHIDWLIRDIRKQLKKPDPRKVYQEDINGCLLEMVRIPQGTFWMGARKDDADARDNEKPLHKVEVPEFWMGKYPVTQRQWYEVSLLRNASIPLDPHPSHFKGDNLPVEQVNWYDAVEFCDRLTQYSLQKKETYPDMKYRLPSEAEWEYACRAGTDTPYHYGQSLTTFPRRKLANFYNKQTSNVGSFQPNNFDLYDMHGNVWEWCQDHFHDDYQEAPTDGSARQDQEQGSHRILRGGSWGVNPRFCRSAYLSISLPGVRFNYIGFRVVCSAPRILQ